MTIAILCPTKGRPEQLIRMRESARRTAVDFSDFTNQGSVRVLHCTSEEDFINLGYLGPHIIMPDGMPTVHKWNMLAQVAINKFPQTRLFMLGADDMIFATPLWDKALLDHYNALDNKIHVYALQDSRDPEGAPHPIVTREWIEAMGWAFPPIFVHWYLDSWTVEIAKANGVFTHMKDYLLIHDKPSDKGQGDETHNRIRAMGWRDRDKYVAETCGDWLELQKHKLANIIASKSMAA